MIANSGEFVLERRGVTKGIKGVRIVSPLE
jgi:hypothetical protein